MFADLAGILGQLLPAFPASSLRLAALSDSGLQLPPARLPSWLSLRRARVRCRLHLRDEGGRKRFVFLPAGHVSARDRLDAVVEVPLFPVPAEGGPGPALGGPPERLSLPKSLRWQEDGTLTLDFPSGSYAVHPPSTDPGVFDSRRFPKRIALAGWPGGGPLESGDRDRSAWPLESLVGFARALAGETRPGGGSSRDWARLPRTAPGSATGIWDLLRDFAEAACDARNQLARIPPVNTPFRMRWEAGRIEARLGILLDPSGHLAAPGTADTFLVPFDLSFPADTPPRGAEVLVGFPDFVTRDPLRAALVRSFASQRTVQTAAAELGHPVGDLVSRLARTEVATFLRVDRREDDDEVLLILEGTLGGVRAASLIHAHRVVYRTLDASAPPSAVLERVRVMLEPSLLSAPMRWDEGKQVFCDLLHGLLRWRSTLQPDSREPSRSAFGVVAPVPGV